MSCLLFALGVIAIIFGIYALAYLILVLWAHAVGGFED